MFSRKLFGLLICVVLGAQFGCSRESATVVHVHDAAIFSFGGGGRLASFTVYEPRAGRHIAIPHDSDSIMWKIVSNRGPFEGDAVKDLTIKYGVVPSHYSQAVPRSQELARLHSGDVYSFFAETTDAPVKEGFFYMDGKSAVQTAIPGLCTNGVTGHIDAVQCGSNQPFVEPSDLATFVNRNRIER